MSSSPTPCPEGPTKGSSPVARDDSSANAELSQSYAAALKEGFSGFVGLGWSNTAQGDTLTQADNEQLEVHSLLSSLKRRGIQRGESKVIIPVNIAEELPMLAQRLDVAAKIVGMQLIHDSSVRVTGMMKPAFSPNEAERENFFDAICSASEKAKLEQCCNLLALYDALSVVPDSSAYQVRGPGQKAVEFLLRLIAGIYCEQETGAPLTESNQWWNDAKGPKDTLVLSLSAALGGADVARCLVTAIEILYRKLIRSLMGSQDHERDTARAELKRIAREHVEYCIASGSVLFFRSLREKTLTVKEEITERKSGRDSKRFILRKKLCQIRPTIPEGPMTSWERTTTSRINEALNQLEGKAPCFSYQKHKDPKKWALMIRSGVDKLYTRVGVYARDVIGRKQSVRMSILAQSSRDSSAANASTTGKTPPGPAITQEQWFKAERDLRDIRSADWEEEALDGFSHLLQVPFHNKKELDSFSKAAIIAELEKVFEDP